MASVSTCYSSTTFRGRKNGERGLVKEFRCLIISVGISLTPGFLPLREALVRTQDATGRCD